jgi:hypothetical protein
MATFGRFVRFYARQRLAHDPAKWNRLERKSSCPPDRQNGSRPSHRDETKAHGAIPRAGPDARRSPASRKFAMDARTVPEGIVNHNPVRSDRFLHEERPG